MNLIDSSRLSLAMQQAGHQVVSRESEADTVIINSCTVTATADKKSRQQAQAAACNGKRVIVTGCGPRVDADGWSRAICGATVVPDAYSVCRVLEIDPCYPQDNALVAMHTHRSRVPILVQNGCDNACTFCITHRARGAHSSMPLDDIVRQVAHVQSLGVKEVVLTGINLGAWGCISTRYPEQSQLATLVHKLLDQTRIERIRLSSIGPSYLSEQLLQLLQNERLCDHLHLSVQSGSRSVLARMGRTNDPQQLVYFAQLARRYRPHVALTADIIVGFPGESEYEFSQTVQLVKQISFAKLHVFPYSCRPETPAASMRAQVCAQLKKKRSALIRQLGTESRRRFIQSQDGRILPALVQGDNTAMTSNYLRMRLPSDRKVHEGQWINLTVNSRNVLES